MNWIKRKLANWVLQDLLCAVDPNKVISIEEQRFSDNSIKRSFKLGSEYIPPQVLANLKEEASYIKRTELWSIFQNRIADTARQKMFEKSENFEDMMWGKAMLYNLKVQKDIVDKLTDGK